ncbi:hypothetical protein V6N13_029713 [Hibiscus sabdariffa]
MISCIPDTHNTQSHTYSFLDVVGADLLHSLNLVVVSPYPFSSRITKDYGGNSCVVVLLHVGLEKLFRMKWEFIMKKCTNEIHPSCTVSNLENLEFPIPTTIPIKSSKRFGM